MTTLDRVSVPPLTICEPRVLQSQWNSVCVQKSWKEKIHAWMSFESAPAYGKKQNYCELTGVVLLIPCSLWLSVFLIKQPDTVKTFTVILQKVTAVFFCIITLPVTILGVLFKGVGELLPHKQIEYKEDSFKVRTHPLLVHACYLMTQKFVDACAKLEFDRFYPVDGTLLGAVRHGGFIPWDDDVDLGFDIKDFDMLTDQLKPLLESEGITWSDNLYKSFSVIKLTFNPVAWQAIVKDFQRSNPAQDIPQELMNESPNIIDLCGTTTMSDGSSWASASAGGRTMFPMDYVPLKDKSEIEKPKQYIRFGSLFLPTFSNETIIRYLKTYYGNDCLIYGVQTHSHGSIDTCWGRIPVPKFYPTYQFKITPVV